MSVCFCSSGNMKTERPVSLMYSLTGRPDGTSSADPSSNTGTSSTRYVRCVYDEWYWEDTIHETVTKNTFTWGDEDRANVRKK